MKGIHRVAILSPLLSLLGCAAIGDDAQQSISQMDSDGSGSGPMLQPRVTRSGDIGATFQSDADPDHPGLFVPHVARGVLAVFISTGALSLHAGGSVECDWYQSDGSIFLSTRLTLQGSDGNFVFYNHTNGKTWGAHTRAVDNPNGPGVTAAFQGDANLVVRNAAGNAIWASNTHTFPQAVLAFQSDGNLVIYNPVEGGYQALWQAPME